ncbi:MAG TPA: CBS domain-containing protein [Dehalococcoidia bacterium]|nr:CBS domain-containing protein [Dehalococcoidia bacterium]
MKVRDIMASNVVTIPSNTSIADAKRIMQAHRFRRLPVEDKGKLVGIVTERRLESVSPSKATSLSVWELSYLLDKTSVKEIMERDVVTVPPDMSAEEALALAQGHKIGSLIVVEGSQVIGMVTTNDFFYKIVNPILGLGIPGSRIEVVGGGESKVLEDVITTINRLGLKIVTLHIENLPEATVRDVCVHVDTEDVGPVIAELEKKGYSVGVRQR